MKREKIPPTTVARLPLYLRSLQLAQNQNIDSISSFELARLTGHNPAQLRKDLSYLGEFGTRGVGYEVDELIRHISRWLGIVKVRSVVLVGAGHLGQALANYRGFVDKGFKIVGIFDNDGAKIGSGLAGLSVKPVSELTASSFPEPIDIGIIATPADVAQRAADILVQAGVRSILNFAPHRLEVGDGVCVRNVDLSTELQIIGFHLASIEHGLSSDCCS